MRCYNLVTRKLSINLTVLLASEEVKHKGGSYCYEKHFSASSFFSSSHKMDYGIIYQKYFGYFKLKSNFLLCFIISWFILNLMLQKTITGGKALQKTNSRIVFLVGKLQIGIWTQMISEVLEILLNSEKCSPGSGAKTPKLRFLSLNIK